MTLFCWKIIFIKLIAATAGDSIADMIALCVAAAGYRASSTCVTAAPRLQRLQTTSPVMQEDGEAPPPAEPEEEPPAPAYGTEAYFAAQRKGTPAEAVDDPDREGFFQIFGGRDKPPPPPATKIEDAFPNVLSADERKVLIEAMRANGLTNFGAPFARPDTSWDAVRASYPILAERSDEDLYSAYMDQTTFKGFGSLFGGGD